MVVNINLRVAPFGAVTLEMGKLASHAREPEGTPVEQQVHYHEPQETASLVYELAYEEGVTNYIVPPSTR